MKKSEFKEAMHVSVSTAPDGPIVNHAVRLAEEAGAQWDPEEPEPPEEWVSYAPAPAVPFELRVAGKNGYVRPTKEQLEEAARKLNSHSALEALAREMGRMLLSYNTRGPRRRSAIARLRELLGEEGSCSGS